MSEIDDLIQQLRSRGKDNPPYPLTNPAYGTGARFWFRKSADALESEHTALHNLTGKVRTEAQVWLDSSSGEFIPTRMVGELLIKILSTVPDETEERE